MEYRKVSLELPEGVFESELIQFTKQDLNLLQVIYRDWRLLSEKLINIGGRAVNIPEGLSESLFF